MSAIERTRARCALAHKRCPSCRGTGLGLSYISKRCAPCKGAGTIPCENLLDEKHAPCKGAGTAMRITQFQNSMGARRRRRQNNALTRKRRFTLAPVLLFYLPTYSAALAFGSPAHQHNALSAIRRLLVAGGDEAAGAVVACGLLPILLVHLAAPSDLQTGVCWCLSSLACSAPTCAALVASGALRLVAVAAGRASGPLREAAIYTLGNVVGGGVGLCNEVLNSTSALEALLHTLHDPTSHVLLCAASWALSNMCSCFPPTRIAEAAVVTSALGALLCELGALNFGDAIKGAASCALGLHYLWRAGAPITFTAQLLSVLLQLTARREAALPAMQLLGCLFGGTDAQTQQAIDAGALGALVPLLCHPYDDSLRLEAALAVSNAAAGCVGHTGAVMAQQGLMPAIVALLGGSNQKCREEAAQAVLNVATADRGVHRAALVALGVPVFFLTAD